MISSWAILKVLTIRMTVSITCLYNSRSLKTTISRVLSFIGYHRVLIKGILRKTVRNRNQINRTINHQIWRNMWLRMIDHLLARVSLSPIIMKMWLWMIMSQLVGTKWLLGLFKTKAIWIAIWMTWIRKTKCWRNKIDCLKKKLTIISRNPSMAKTINS